MLTEKAKAYCLSDSVYLQFPAKDFFFFLLRLHNMAIKRNAGILVLDHLQKQTISPL